jgi:glycosyl-4,4'-diaponeurosporenoate acyltransferase
MVNTEGRCGLVMALGDLPPVWAILINAAAWFVIQFGAAVLSSRVPLARFDPRGWLFRARAWERDGRIYDRILRVREWKRALPDGAALFRSGFRKRRMTGRSPGYCAQFIQETCRAELSHWLTLTLLPLFFTWNPLQIALLMIPYAIATNVPCIVAQRYNRPRLSALARRQVDSSRNHATVGTWKQRTADNRKKQRVGWP